MLCPRALAELEEQLVEEETARRVAERVAEMVRGVMESDQVKRSLQERMELERKNLEEQVGQQRLKKGWGVLDSCLNKPGGGLSWVGFLGWGHERSTAC